MPLRIIRASDPVTIETLCMVIYGPPGAGKTSLGFSAKNPLLLDADRGIHRSRNRRDAVPLESWADAASITADFVKGASTLVVDTAGRALDLLSADIIKENSKWGSGGALSLQGFGVLKTRFTAWLKHIRSFGLDVVLLCHADEQKNGEQMIERLDVQGRSKDEIYKSADAMGRIYFERGKRMLNFSPTDVSFGKNPGQFAAEEVPDFADNPDYLGDVIARTKASINEMTAEQKKTSDALGEWKARVDGASSPADFDGILADARQAPEALRASLKALIAKAAKGEGLSFDAKADKFVVAEKKRRGAA